LTIAIQSASLSKRFSAFLTDIFVFAILFLLTARLFSALFGYDSGRHSLEAAYQSYADKYGISLDITEEEFEKLSSSQKELYYLADEEIAKDSDLNALYKRITILGISTLTASILLSCIISELIIPLFLKNGQTLGKKAFGIALTDKSSRKIKNSALFIRAMLGKFLLGYFLFALCIYMTLFGIFTPFPSLILILVFFFNAILCLLTKNKISLADILSGTVVCDLECQIIREGDL
jgi:uncharacterized RDD family membrane protein YckC